MLNIVRNNVSTTKTFLLLKPSLCEGGLPSVFLLGSSTVNKSNLKWWCIYILVCVYVGLFWSVVLICMVLISFSSFYFYNVIIIWGLLLFLHQCNLFFGSMMHCKATNMWRLDLVSSRFPSHVVLKQNESLPMLMDSKRA